MCDSLAFLLVLTVLYLCVYRKAQESQKEMKLLLDMYRSAPKEQRDKVQLMAAEKKAKAEVNLISLAIFSSITFSLELLFKYSVPDLWCLCCQNDSLFLFSHLSRTIEADVVWS